MIQAEMFLDHLMFTYTPGEEWDWEVEFTFLRRVHGNYMDMLMASIQETGIQTPIHLGDDGRVWDGHHRIYAAYRLGIQTVPVIFSAKEER